jgi:adenylate cyclase, class 2
MEEFEIKYINIDKDEIIERLLDLGAKKEGDYHYRRIVFDYPNFQLDKQSSWLRLRDEGDKTTLTFKQRRGKDLRDKLDGDEGMTEYETEVGDFNNTREILLQIGLIEKMYQENKRTRYVIDDVECDIDTWPLLDPYLEIEGSNWDKVYEVAEKLGLKREDGKKYSTNQIYRLKGMDDRNYTKLTFSEQIERIENRF